jgi:hypothetical protein
VWDNVINNSCGFQYSHGVTLGAERMLPEKLLTDCAPFGTVSSCPCGAPLAVEFSLLLNAMLLASAVTGLDERSASGIAAWMSWGVWHFMNYFAKPLP